MRPVRQELAADRIAELRRRLADPEYMDRAISHMADDLVHDMFRGDGSDEPHFQETGKAPVRDTE